ncbi:MAG TPA: biotin/lipoate A/B protein ligase family protein [Candidatus Eisenbacteria bacterium]|nr:biotin/lipoate A/B protein ligase family protein [Candidatus Eisenbacteria bacterium]
MKHCDVSPGRPEENLACDEALLDLCEAGESGELLRFWEPNQNFVVAGYGNRVSAEVNVEFCEENGIPILRRCTGGGAVLQGPGVLNYCLILRAEEGPCGTIQGTNRFVMERLRTVVSDLLKKRVEVQGHTDLAIGGLKICGNAQRRKKSFLIFHGSFLLGLDLRMVERTLRMPSKQPEYRGNRAHRDFLLNLGISSGRLKDAMCDCWNAQWVMSELPKEEIRRLVEGKYGRREWNFKF